MSRRALPIAVSTARDLPEGAPVLRLERTADEPRPMAAAQPFSRAWTRPACAAQLQRLPRRVSHRASPRYCLPVRRVAQRPQGGYGQAGRRWCVGRRRHSRGVRYRVVVEANRRAPPKRAPAEASVTRRALRGRPVEGVGGLPAAGLPAFPGCRARAGPPGWATAFERYRARRWPRQRQRWPRSRTVSMPRSPTLPSAAPRSNRPR